MALVENGAHMDTVNQLGATPFDSATTGIPTCMFTAYDKKNSFNTSLLQTTALLLHVTYVIHINIFHAN